VGYYAAAMAVIQIGSSVLSGKKSKSAAKKSAQLAELQNKQKVRTFLRNFRKQQAMQVSVAGARAGGLESSRVQGTLGSQRTQAFTGIVEAHQINQLQKKILKKGGQAQTFNLLGDIAGAAGNFFSSSAGQDVTD